MPESTLKLRTSSYHWTLTFFFLCLILAPLSRRLKISDGRYRRIIRRHQGNLMDQFYHEFRSCNWVSFYLHGQFPLVSFPLVEFSTCLFDLMDSDCYSILCFASMMVMNWNNTCLVLVTFVKFCIYSCFTFLCFCL